MILRFAIPCKSITQGDSKIRFHYFECYETEVHCEMISNCVVPNVRVSFVEKRAEKCLLVYSSYLAGSQIKTK